MQFRLTKPVGATISSPVSNGHFATSGTSTWGSWVLSTDPTGWQSTTLNRAAGLTPQASESMLYTLCLTVSSPSTYGYCICGGFNFTQIGLAATEVAAYEIVGLTVTLPSGTTTCASAQQTKKVFTNDLKVTTNNPNVQYYGANSAPTSSCAGTKWGSGYPPAGCSV
ncbi:MAG: hypothetical protein Q4G35_05480 [Propionibacteriaceae bacterium]|nr:hypothetical protein [Propionibacteriaceae bacterium]